MGSGWRFFATRIHGDGTETLVADELPVSHPRVMRVLSGAGGINGRLSPEISRLRDSNGVLLLAPGRTGLYAETPFGVILGGGIVSPGSSRKGPDLKVQAEGHAGYLHGQPYRGNEQWVQEDPANLVRHAWEHVQARAGHNLGMIVDNTTTPVRVGTPEEQVTFSSGGEDVEFTAGPVKWNYWTTFDLGREVDHLARNTPLDYVTRHSWSGGELRHELRMAHPAIGRRRSDLSFVVGVNVLKEPEVESAAHVSDVLVLGAGEGSSGRRGAAHRSTGGLGRTVVLVDKTLTTNAACAQRAEQELSWLGGGDDLRYLQVHDHPNAPLGSWALGDELRVQGGGSGWAGDLDTWVRVLADDTDPHTGTATLTVTRSGRK